MNSEVCREAILLAGGESWRLKPDTDVPKPMLKLNKGTLLEYQLKWLIQHKFEHIIVASSTEYPISPSLDEYVTWSIEKYKKGCYDDDTEVLTKAGWKYFKDITLNDEILTLNKNNFQMEYQKPLRKVEGKSNKMIHFKNKHLDILVTPDHNMFVGVSKKGIINYGFMKATDMLKGKFFFYRSGIWVGKKEQYFVLPKIAKVKNHIETHKKELNMNIWLDFFGRWIAEGWTHRNKRGYSISLRTESLDFKNKYIADLNNLGFKHSIFRRKNMWEINIYNKQLWTYLRQFGKARNKFVPIEIKNLCKEQLSIFLDAYIDGDGLRKTRDIIYTSSKQLSDDTQEISLKLGGYCNYGRRTRLPRFIKSLNRTIYPRGESYDVYLKGRRKTISTDHITKEVVDYSGKIWCAEVPNHIMYIRRGGKAWWCGNTGGAVMLAIEHLKNKSFYLMNVDDITFYNPIELCLPPDVEARILVSKPRFGFGRVELRQNLVLGFKEKPMLDFYVNAGHYFMKKHVVEKYFPDNGNLEDTVLPRLARERILENYRLRGKWITVNTMKDYLEACEVVGSL